MNMKKMGLMLVVIFLFISLAFVATAEKAKFPKAKDYLGAHNVSPVILNRAEIPDEYLFPNDWVKTVDWDAIKKKFDGTTITMATEGTDIQAPQMFAEHFEKLSGIKVDLLGIPPVSLFEKFLISFVSGTSAYDLIEYYSMHMPVFMRFLDPLNDYIKKYNYTWDDWLPLWKQLSSFEGNVYALPYDCDLQFFLARTKYMDQAGIKKEDLKTWEGVEEACKKLKKILPEGVYPIGFMGQRSWVGFMTYLNFLAAWGGDLFEPGTWKPAINSPEAIAAMEFFKHLVDEYGAPGTPSWGYTEHLSAWNAGQLAMCIQFPNQESYNPQMSSIADEERWHLIIPKGPPPKGRYAPDGNMSTSILGIPKNAANKEAAFIFAAFLSSAETSFIYTITGTGMDPGRKSIFDHELLEKFYPNRQAWMESGPYAYFMARVPETAELLAEGAAEMHDALTGRKTPKEACESMNKKWTVIMEKGGYFKPDAPEPKPLYMQTILKQQ